MAEKKPVLTVDDWIEIYDALDSKIYALKADIDDFKNALDSESGGEPKDEKAKAALAEGHGTAAALIELKAQKGRSK